MKRSTPTTPFPATGPGPDDPFWQPDAGPARPEPTRSGRRVILLAVLITLIGLLTRNLWLALLGFGAMSGPIVSSMLRPRLDQLVYELRGPARGVVGEPSRIVVELHNRSARSQPPVLMTCRTEGFAPLVLRVPALGPGEHGRIVTEQRPVRRGESEHSWVRLECRAPFGLARRTMVRGGPHQETILVHPRRMPPERIEQLGGEGERPSGQRDRDGGQPWSMREYRPGDPVRQVHWRSTARRGQLVVVEPERTVAERLAVLAVGGTDDPAWEDVLARAAWTVADLLARGGQVLLATAGAASATGDPAAALDWFARLPPALPPDADDLAERLRAAGGGDVLVLAPDTVPPGWWVMARSVAAATGCRLLRAGS